jgi:hypothetical protein
MKYAQRGTANSNTPEYKAAYMRGWRKRNPEKAKVISDRAYVKYRAHYIARASRWNKANPLVHMSIIARARIKRVYGLSPEQFFELWEKQNKSCAICLKPMQLGAHGLSGIDAQIDHDHISGKVRGLLCKLCNLRIGVLENTAWLPAARHYLVEHNSAIL